MGPGWRSSMAEQLICNQQVVGSNPIASSSHIVLVFAKVGTAQVFKVLNTIV